MTLVAYRALGNGLWVKRLPWRVRVEPTEYNSATTHLGVFRIGQSGRL